MPNRVSGPGERFFQLLFLGIYIGVVVLGVLTDRAQSVYLRATRIFPICAQRRPLAIDE